MKKKRKKIWILLCFPIFVYLGYVLGTMAAENNFTLEKFPVYLITPLPLCTDNMAIVGVLCGCLMYLSVVLYGIKTRNNNAKMRGKEFGTARFENPQIITRKLGFDPAKVLGNNTLLSIHDRKTQLNNNLLLIGGSGAGKSFRFVKPNILRCHGSMIITDPKGELLRDTGKYLRKQGYKVKVLNLVEMTKSDHYNPLAYIRTQSDVVKLVTAIIKNTNPKNAAPSDPFWEKAESLYLQSLIFYVWLAPVVKGNRNLKSVIELMKLAKVPENEKEKSELDKKMEALTKTEWSLKDPVSGKTNRYPGKDHPAYTSYMMIRSGAVDTVRSILISANARLGFLVNSPELLEMLSRDEMEIAATGMGYRGIKQKTALFCVIPDSDTTYNSVVGMLYTQIFQELYFQADNRTDKGRLKIPVSFWMDEFSNVALPNDFCSLLSTMRSRGISCNVIIQNLAQIKEKYEKTWETITGNCDTLVYLGGNEQSTHKYISELLGKWTIEKQSSSNSRSIHGSSSVSFDLVGRELMTSDEVRMLDNEKEIIFIRGQYPVLDEKFDTLKDKRFQTAEKIGHYKYEDYHKPLAIAERPQVVQVLNKEETDFVKEKKGFIIQATLKSLEELSSHHIEYHMQLTDEEFNAYVVANLKKDRSNQDPSDTLKIRMSKRDYSDEQMFEAVQAIQDGQTEEEILRWFRPEVPAEEMKSQREKKTKKPKSL